MIVDGVFQCIHFKRGAVIGTGTIGVAAGIGMDANGEAVAVPDDRTAGAAACRIDGVTMPDVIAGAAFANVAACMGLICEVLGVAVAGATHGRVVRTHPGDADGVASGWVAVGCTEEAILGLKGRQTGVGIGIDGENGPIFAQPLPFTIIAPDDVAGVYGVLVVRVGSDGCAV